MEFIKECEYSRSMSFLDLGLRSFLDFVLKPPGSLLATDRSKAVVLV